MMRSALYICLGLVSAGLLAGCGSTCSSCNGWGNVTPPVVARPGIVPSPPIVVSTEPMLITPAARPTPSTASTAPTPLPSPSPRPPAEQFVVVSSPPVIADEQLPNIPALPGTPTTSVVELPREDDPPALGVAGTLTIDEPTGPMAIPAALPVGKIGPTETIDIIIDPAGGPLPQRADTSMPLPPDKTVADQRLGHSDDYKMLTGQVQTWRGTARLRYAPIDQEDPFGGFVILEGHPDLAKLRDGQHIRVRGILMDLNEIRGPVHYRVQSVEILD